MFELKNIFIPTFFMDENKLLQSQDRNFPNEIGIGKSAM